MKHFHFDNKKYPLPESWKEVTLKQLVQIIKAEREEDNPLLKAARIVSILTGIKYETLEECESTLTLMLAGQLGFMEATPKGNIQHFKIGDDTYYVNSLRDSILKEFATFNKIEDDFTEKPEDAMALKLAVLCRKDGESFLEVEDLMDERAKLFETLDAETVFKINGFFLLRANLSKLSSVQYSLLVKEKEAKEQHLLKLISRSGDGSVKHNGWRVRLHKWILSMLGKLSTRSSTSNTKSIMRTRWTG